MGRLTNTYIFDNEITEGKMAFLTGPRQIGKTTFARGWLKSSNSAGNYFNWDDPTVMVAYKNNPLFFKNCIDEKYTNELVPMVFDEIHKHGEWRNILKGLFDVNREKIRLLVTGSARLGFTRMSGDSLFGRYFSFQMLPLGLSEVMGDFTHVLNNEGSFSGGHPFASYVRGAGGNAAIEGLDLLLRFGGFPEPLIKGSERFHRRWQRDYKTLLTKEDGRDLSRISDIKGLETLVEMLPAKVGSRLSIPSLSEGLGRNYDTIKNWRDRLEGLYLLCTIRPWHRRITRAIKKGKKIYFFDWSLLPDDGSRFENLIAVALLRMVARFNETGIGNFELRYVRDREKRAVDFIMVKGNAPLALFEAKTGNRVIHESGRHFSERLNRFSERISRRACRSEAEIPLSGATGLASESKIRQNSLRWKIPCSLLQGLQYPLFSSCPQNRKSGRISGKLFYYSSLQLSDADWINRGTFVQICQFRRY